MRAVLRACGAVAGLVIAMTLMRELVREFYWSDELQLAFVVFVALPTVTAAAAAVSALGHRLTSRPSWLAPTVLGLGALALAASGAWGIRAVSDQLAVGALRSLGERELTRTWESEYAGRYWNAAAATVRQTAWIDERVGAPVDSGVPDVLAAMRRAQDPRRYPPARPPDDLVWTLQRLRAGPRASDDVFVGELRVRWRGVPYEMPAELGGPFSYPRTLEVREVLQWVGPAQEPNRGGWRVVSAEAGFQ